MRPTRRTIRYHSLTRRQVVGIKNISYPFDAYFEEFKKSSTVDPVFIDEAEKVGLVVSTHMQLSKLSRLERCHRFNRTNSFSPLSLANVKESDLPDIRCCVICHKPIEDVDPLDLRILRGTPVTPSDATHFASKSYVRCANAACLSRTLSPPLPHSFPQNLCFHPERLLRRLQTSQGAIQGARQRTRQGRSQATGLRQRRRNAPASSLAPQRLRQRGGKARSSAASLALHTRAHLPRGRQRRGPAGLSAQAQARTHPARRAAGVSAGGGRGGAGGDDDGIGGVWWGRTGVAGDGEAATAWRRGGRNGAVFRRSGFLRSTETRRGDWRVCCACCATAAPREGLRRRRWRCCVASLSGITRARTLRGLWRRAGARRIRGRSGWRRCTRCLRVPREFWWRSASRSRRLTRTRQWGRRMGSAWRR